MKYVSVEAVRAILVNGLSCGWVQPKAEEWVSERLDPDPLPAAAIRLARAVVALERFAVEANAAHEDDLESAVELERELYREHDSALAAFRALDTDGEEARK